MKRLATVLALVLLSFLPSWAAPKTRDASGLWSTAVDWNPDGVPVAGDDITISGVSVILDSAAACAGGASACGQTLTISAGASVTLGRGTTFLWINCATATYPCIDVSGTLIGNAGQTLRIGADGGAGNQNPDRVRVNNGGRLSGFGQRLQVGTVTSVITDEATITNPNLAFGLPTRDFVFEDASARFPMTAANVQEWASADDCVDNCYVIRFTSGERAGRWYNLKATSTNPTTRLTVDFDSRSNPASVTNGIGLAANATAKADGYGRAYVTGTAAVAAQTVTGTGTSWSIEFALGSRWYCDADGPASAKRVVRVVSGTSMILESNYAGGGCGATAAYHLVDDNQPYPFMDHSEHIRPGDGYEIIRPFNITGAVITTGAEPDGATAASFTNVECVAGSICQFGFTAIRWVGGFTTVDTLPANSGVLLTGARAFTDTEIKGSATTFMLMLLNGQGMDVGRNFLHYSSPSLSCQGCGHALVFEDSGQGGGQAPIVQVGNKLHDNRMELTNDDTTWVRAPQSGFRRFGNITKYIGSSLLSETANCVEYGGYVASNPAGSFYFFDTVDTDNVCMNFGSIGCAPLNEYSGGPCSGITWRTQGVRGGSGYRVDLGISRNLIANAQTGSGAEWEGTANPSNSQAEFNSNSVTIAGNAVMFTAFDGIGGAQNHYNNLIHSWGLNRQMQNQIAYAAISFVPRNTKGNITIPVDEAITTPVWVATGSIRSGIWVPPLNNMSGNLQCVGAGNPDSCCSGAGTGTCPQVGHESNPVISDNVLFGHSMIIRLGSNAGVRLVGNPDVLIQNNYISCELSRVAVGDDVVRGVDQWRDGAGSGENGETVTNNTVTGCSASNLNVRGFGSPPTLTENNNYLLNAPAGVTPAGSDSLSANLAWSPLSLSFDRRSDSAIERGPRSVGLLMNPLWKTRVHTSLMGTNQAGVTDTDGDGISDRFDNCKNMFNPTQLDNNLDGKGDACGG